MLTPMMININTMGQGIFINKIGPGCFMLSEHGRGNLCCLAQIFIVI